MHKQIKKGKVLVPALGSNAGKWIYDGYARAWKHLGYEVERYIDFTNQDADYLMINDHWVGIKGIQYSKYKKVFLFVSCSNMPEPYCNNVNFVSVAARNKNLISHINDQPNVLKWSFINDEGSFLKWGDVKYIPLAYDNIGYEEYGQIENSQKFDVVFIGGYADNGFNTKKRIMLSIFKKFMHSSLKCGFFLNKDLTHVQEITLLNEAGVCLNIHDEYQRVLGHDINERNFKALGLNGCMVSDYVEEGVRLLGDDIFFKDEHIVDAVTRKLNMTKHDRNETREMIKRHHSYINRVGSLLEE